MGFWNGRVTFTRYRVGGSSPLPFGEEILEQAAKHLIGQHGAADPADGIATGWAGGDHVLDLNFELGKNIVDDAFIWPSASTPTRSRAAAPCLHPDRDRGAGPVEPERRRHQGPAAGSQGGRQAPGRSRSRRRPVPPAQSLPDPLGRPVEHALRRQHQHDGPRPAPSPVPRDVRSDPRADHGRQPGLRPDSRRPRRTGAPDRKPRSRPAGPGRRQRRRDFQYRLGRRR